MARPKLSPQEFREDFDVHNYTDFQVAHDVIAHLDETRAAEVVQAARKLLEAGREFDAALGRAGIRDPLEDLTSKI